MFTLYASFHLISNKPLLIIYGLCWSIAAASHVGMGLDNYNPSMFLCDIEVVRM